MLFLSLPVSVSLVLCVSDIYCIRVPMLQREHTHKLLMQPADLCFTVTCGGSWSSLEHHRLSFQRILLFYPATDC